MNWFAFVLLLQAATAGEPSPVRGILSATPFSLGAAYRSDWSAEHPEVRGGTVLVVDVDPAWLVLRNGPQPVLYVGASPAEVLRRDVEAGRIVVVVPGPLGREVAVYFGAETLPETVTAAEGERQLAAALAAGTVPLPVPAIAPTRLVIDRAGLDGL